MKIIPSAEMEHIVLGGKGRSTKVRLMLSQLKVGDGLHITREEWTRKRPPYIIVNYFSKKTGRKFQQGRAPDGSGWLVKRLT